MTDSASDATMESAAAETQPIEQASAPKPRSRVKKSTELPAVERRNWLIHQHFVRKDLETCKQLIKEQLHDTGGACEYALYVKGMISRNEGQISESTELLQSCSKINPNSAEALKQIGTNMFLFGKYKNAIECYKKAQEVSTTKDWEISHELGVCFLHLKQYDKAEECLVEALSLSKHDITFSTLSNLYLEQRLMDKAMDILKAGVKFAPENLHLLTTLGLLHLRMQNFHDAFELLGQAMTFDPENYKAILAAGSLMQIHGDFDVALTKYRVAAQKAPESAALWNNIAMCFFGKKKYVASISCLKRATYLAPFDWKILYNLCLVHLTMQQYASAFQFGSSALKLKPKNANLYLLLAVALTHLGEMENARKSYEEALALSPDDAQIILNYAAFLRQNNETKQAQKLVKKLEQLVEQNPKSLQDKEIIDAARKLAAALQLGEKFLRPPTDQVEIVKKKTSKRQRDLTGTPKTSPPPGEEIVPSKQDSIAALETMDSPMPASLPASSLTGAGILPPVGGKNKLPSIPKGGKLPSIDNELPSQ